MFRTFSGLLGSPWETFFSFFLFSGPECLRDSCSLSEGLQHHVEVDGVDVGVPAVANDSVTH